MNTLTMHNIFKNSIITGGEIMLKSRILRKVLAVSLSAVTIFGAGFTSVGQFVGTNISASAIFGNQTYGDFWYEINDDGTVNITKYIGKNTYVTIPTAIYGRKVTTISGFYSSYPKNIIIPDTVTTLAEHAFNGCENLTDIVIPASVKTIGKVAFLGCTSLTGVPELPATTLASTCYLYMFANCTSLTTAPELPATTLAEGCYSAMFYGCTSLTTAPVLPATTLAENCYIDMFQGCTSLITAPALPATTLVDYCYSRMFLDCTNLTYAPALPATTLSENCYDSMFKGCTSLTNAPVLPATTLATYCYEAMFSGCTSLTYIKAMFTTTPSTSYTSKWVSGVAASGTFVKNVSATWTTTGANGVPTGWTTRTENQ